MHSRTSCKVRLSLCSCAARAAERQVTDNPVFWELGFRAAESHVPEKSLAIWLASNYRWAH